MIYRLEFELMDGKLRYRICDGCSDFVEPNETLHLKMMNATWVIDVKPVGFQGEVGPGAGGRWLNGCTSPRGHHYGTPGMRCLSCGDPRPESEPLLRKVILSDNTE